MRTLGLALAVLALAACGDDSGSSTTSFTTSTAAPTTSTTTTEVAVPVDPPGGTLEVRVVGDSVMHDAEPGIAAALEATGGATVSEETAFGLGFSDGAAIPFAEGADDVLAGPPVDQVVVMVGSWDHLTARRDPEAYAAQVHDAYVRLAEGGRQVLVLGEPPSDPAKGEDADRAAVNEILEAEAAEVDGVRFAATDTVIGDAEGQYQRVDAQGRLLRKPDGRHLCPDGAVRFGASVADLLADQWVLAQPGTAWEAGDWRGDGRYEDPAGACPGP